MQEVREGGQEEREGGLEVDAVGGEDDGGFEGSDFVREGFAPVACCG